MTQIAIILTNLRHWLAVLFALYFGAFVAFVVLLLTVIVTLNRFLALSAALLAFSAVGWTLRSRSAASLLVR